jgi:hypothetical protein
MSKEQHNDDSLIKRYLALKALRDNILYTKPLTDTAAGIAEDIPGPIRALSGPLADSVASRAIISNDPEVRKQQIAEAIKKVRGAASDSGEMKHQMLTNAARLGAVAAPVGFIGGGLLSLLGKGKGIGSRLNLLRAPSQTLVGGGLNAAGKYKKELLHAALHGAGESGALGALGGAMGGLAAGTAKPNDNDISAAAEILQNHPYTSGLPGGELASVLNSYDKDMSPAQSTALGAGVGAGVGAASSFIPPTLAAAGAAVTNPFRKSPTPVNLLGRYTETLRGPLGRNALILGGLGGLAGLAVNQKSDV